MIKVILEDLKANKIYSFIVIALLTWFAYTGFSGNAYYKQGSVQHNAGYSGPIPHSGYGVRFYHK